jgi:hypothetical protein
MSHNGARQLGTGTMTNWLLGFRLKRTHDIREMFSFFSVQHTDRPSPLRDGES